MKPAMCSPLLSAIFFVFGICLQAAFAQSPAADVSFEEMRLATLRDDFSCGDYTFSPDGRRVAYVAHKEGEESEWRITFNDERGEAFDYVEQNTLVFSPDGRRVGYIALKDKKRFVVVDGIRMKDYDSVEALKFSGDGKRYAYIAKSGYRQFAVIDGKESTEYDKVGEIAFGRNGNRVAFSARRGDSWCTVLDGVEGEECVAVSRLRFSPDGSRFAYVATKGELPFLVVDGKRLPQEISCVEPLCFSPDNTRLMTLHVTTKWERLIFVNGERLLSTPLVQGPQFSPDSKHIGLVASSENSGRRKCWVTVDGKPGREYDHISGLVFSPNSRKVVYAASADSKLRVVVDEISGETHDYDAYDYIHSGIYFSGDSTRVAYIAGTRNKENTREFVVVDGVRGEELDVILSDRAVFEPLHFSPDGTMLAYGAKQGRELWWKVMRLK